MKKRLTSKILIPIFLAFLTSIVTPSNYAYSKQYTIIMLGDSLTEGYGLDKEQAFPALTQEILSGKGYDVKIINAGVSGSTSASALARLQWLIGAKPTHMFLELGANDGLRGLSTDAMKKNLDAAIKFAKEKNIEPLLAGMKLPPNYGVEYSKRFEKVFSELSKEHKIPLMPFFLEGIAGDRSLNLPDGIHPNAKGHKILGKNVADFLEKNIKFTKKEK